MVGTFAARNSPGLPRLPSVVNEPAEWTDLPEIRMHVALHFIKAKGGREWKKKLGGGGWPARKERWSTLIQLPRLREIHRPSLLTKDRYRPQSIINFNVFST